MRLVILFIGLGMASLDLMAQQVTALVEFTSTWRYNNLATDLGATWRASSFNDASWASGQTLLGLEDSVPNPYAIHGLTVNTINIGPNPGRYPTIYFRSHFNSPVAGTTPGVSLIMSNLVDDGCVIYLNGIEAGRIRVAANQTYASFATGGPSPEGALDTIVINPALLKSGDNVLAVEVHNAATDSSDLVFGARVMLFRPIALAITNQPQSQTVAVGDAVNFTVGVSGGPIFYQWQKGAGNTYTNILNATNAAYAISQAALTSAGDYRAIATNLLNAVTSSVATLTVTADTDGPQVVEAILNNVVGGTVRSNTINIFFNEAVSTSLATNPASVFNTNNYQLILATNPTNRIPILSVQYNGSVAQGALLNVQSTNANWNPTNEYYLIINNIADTRGNNIAPNTVVGVSILVTANLTQMGDTWNFFNLAFAFPEIYSNMSPPYPWYGTNYYLDALGTDPTGIPWGTGPGILFADPNPPVTTICAGDTTGQSISFQNQPTLFRRTFNLPPGLPGSGTFRFRFLRDDGLVLFLNGVEIKRLNMPAGPLTMDSLAVTNVSDFGCETLTFEVNNLHTAVGTKPGTNVLAAAVYQSSTPESDTWFGLEMDYVTQRISRVPTNSPPGTPTLVRNVISTPQGKKFVLSWPATNYGYTLQYSTDIIGTGSRPDRNWWTNQARWFQVSDQANPYTNMIPPTTGPRRFYRLYRETLN